MLGQKKKHKKILYYIALPLIVLLVISGSVWVYLFFSSPTLVRLPKMEHAHFRMQVVIDGVKEDFASAKYQMPYEKGVCSALLSNEPIHFHDSKDQIVHLHWKGATGGDVLKYYRWNLTGGPEEILGYRFDTSLVPQPVPVHTTGLPAIPSDAKLWVYTGNEDSYRQQTLSHFLNQNLEDFFGRKSSVNTDMVFNVQNLFGSTAYAHSGHEHNDAKTSDELEDINNLLGNVVLFVQRDEPTGEQVAERFNHLESLTDSTCGG